MKRKSLRILYSQAFYLTYRSAVEPFQELLNAVRGVFTEEL